MKEKIHYVLFKAAPNTQPPFSIELGISPEKKVNISECANIPDAITKLETFALEYNLDINDNLNLIYPIYLEFMNSEHEMTMHQIAWLIKDEADKKSWNFDRVGGYTGKTPESFLG